MSGSGGPTGGPGPGAPGGLGSGLGPASPIIRWMILFAGIMLVVFGPDSSLGLAGLALGLALVVLSLVWWMRSEARRR